MNSGDSGLLAGRCGRLLGMNVNGTSAPILARSEIRAPITSSMDWSPNGKSLTGHLAACMSCILAATALSTSILNAGRTIGVLGPI